MYHKRNNVFTGKITTKNSVFEYNIIKNTKFSFK